MQNQLKSNVSIVRKRVFVNKNHKQCTTKHRHICWNFLVIIFSRNGLVLKYLRLKRCIQNSVKHLGWSFHLSTIFAKNSILDVWLYSEYASWLVWSILAGNYVFKVNNRNARTRCEICSKLTIKTPQRRGWRRCGVFIVNFEQISHLVVVFILLTLSRYMPAGIYLMTRICLILQSAIQIFWQIPASEKQEHCHTKNFIWW